MQIQFNAIQMRFDESGLCASIRAPPSQLILFCHKTRSNSRTKNKKKQQEQKSAITQYTR